MGIVLYDLAGGDDRRFSPNCWRTRMALAHKGLEHEARATGFLDIANICGGTQKTVPVIEHDGKVVAESFAIAEYLADTWPERPPLFHGPGGRALTLHLDHWVSSVVHPAVARLIMLDLHANLRPEERTYFRTSREGRFKMTLEQFQDRSPASVAAFRALFGPMRLTLAKRPFLGGAAPLYADYLVFGAFMWARVVSPFALLAEDDPMNDWVERCLDLHGGLARGARTVAD